MRLDTRAVGRGRYVRRGHLAAGGAAAFLFAVGLLAAPVLQAQGTQAGTQFSNWATLSFTSGGTGYAVASDTVAILVGQVAGVRSEEHTSELQSLAYLVCRLLLEKKKKDGIQRTMQRLIQHGARMLA